MQPFVILCPIIWRSHSGVLKARTERKQGTILIVVSLLASWSVDRDGSLLSDQLDAIGWPQYNPDSYIQAISQSWLVACKAAHATRRVKVVDAPMRPAACCSSHRSACTSTCPTWRAAPEGTCDYWQNAKIRVDLTCSSSSSSNFRTTITTSLP